MKNFTFVLGIDSFKMDQKTLSKLNKLGIVGSSQQYLIDVHRLNTAARVADMVPNPTSGSFTSMDELQRYFPYAWVSIEKNVYSMFACVKIIDDYVLVMLTSPQDDGSVNICQLDDPDMEFEPDYNHYFLVRK